uniref:Immunoglobulin like and fibronectin type III domain containing 1, tandem duplicate 1 n=1 Tax=Oncorhynchus tshawytscha TaxID=74940 RepID=A0AAZ3RPH7_ONCTS
MDGKRMDDQTSFETYVEEIPEGKSHPDFTRKPIALTIQEGKFGVFKAIVYGEPTPNVTWNRANGKIDDPVKFQSKYDEASGEHTLEIPKVCAEDADTYKCFATNEYGKAVCTIQLNVIEVGFKKTKELAKSKEEQEALKPGSFRTMLKKRGDVHEQKPLESEEKVWEILMSADKKDYEQICAEYGITNFRGMLTKLAEMKKEREVEQAQFIEHISSLKHIEVNADENATFEIDMDLKDASSRIFLYKDGVMVPYTLEMEEEMKHQLKRVGKKFIFTIKNLDPEDAGLYSVDVEGVNIFSTDFKIPPVNFAVKIQEVKAEERQDAIFQCVLTAPMAEINWMGKSAPIENDDKFEITVSEDKLIHKLLVKDCQPLDAGIYAAVAGIHSCNAWLVVEALPLIVNLVNPPDPGVHFNLGLSDVTAILGDPAELVCKLSKENVDGVWYLNGEEIQPDDVLTMSKDGFFQSLKISKISEDYAGKYKFEADGRKTEAMIVVEGLNLFDFFLILFDTEELKKFTVPIITKKGQKATFKIPFVGRDPMKIQWYHDGEELSDDTNIKIEHGEGYSQLTLNKLQRKDTGEIKFKLKNEFGTVEAFAKIIVTDKPTPPLGPLEIIEASQNAIEVKWRSPKDDGGCKILNYILERQQIGRNTWKKLGPIGPEAHYKDSDVDHGRRYCYKIRADTEMGSSELMETEDVQAAYAGPPSAPKVVSAFKDCITLTWNPPSNTGGTNILGYNMEKRKKGSNLWSPVNPEFGVKDVIEGMEYEFRVAAINNSGAGEFGTPSEFVFARDPKKPPGKVIDLKVTDSTYTTLSLGWTKPREKAGVEDEAKGFFVEIRPAESPEWDRCNNNPSTMTSFTVKGMKSMAMYWVRVIATNDGGEGKPQELDNYILAMPPPVRPRFTDQKVKSFMVVQAGNSARFNMNFEASPWPDVTWMKDGMPVSKRVTISNAEGASQLLIPSSERSDTGIYTIMVKNIVGQETFSIEIRVTDEPKPPGPVEVDENVPGTVTISWSPSPDEKRDDRLHYLVSKRDSSKRTWHTVADHIFNNKFTACNIMPGREYQFRVYAKNDMGSSQPSESPKWEITGKKERFVLDRPETKTCNLERPPKFLVPLKMHTAPQGYECYMSCAVRGDPTPHVTWYRNNISLNTNTNYLISNTCGVCSMLILRVGPKDTGEYKIIAENNLGRAECSTKKTPSKNDLLVFVSLAHC